MDHSSHTLPILPFFVVLTLDFVQVLDVHSGRFGLGEHLLAECLVHFCPGPENGGLRTSARTNTRETNQLI